MASAEMQLVCRIIKSGELKQVIEWGITEDDFLTLECKGIYKQLLAIYLNPETSGSVLGPRLASEKFGQLNLDEVDSHVTTEHLCIEIRNRRISKEIKEGCERALQEADTSPLNALSHLQLTAGNVLRLDAGKTTDIDFSVGMEQLLEEYRRVKSGEVTGKFVWPWDPLQQETGGGQEDDYVVFYGRPKSMKSWVLCYVISMLISMDFRVLVYTKEMTSKNIYKRIAACLAGLPYNDVRHGRLTLDQEYSLAEWVNIARDLAGQNRLVVLSAKDVAGRDTVAWLRSKVDRYAPHVIAIDGLYLMSPDNPKITRDNDRVQNISRGIRQLILDTKTPVIATMQANRKAAGHGDANLDEIAFSDAISQDATMLVRVINDSDGPTISLVFGGAREIKFAGMRIKGVPATDFSFYSMLTEKEAENAKKADDPEEPKKAKREPRVLQGAGQPQRAAVARAFERNLDRAIKNA
jgi:replicative DNA helicase